MSICTTFNCYLAASFSQKEQKTARDVLRIIRINGLDGIKQHSSLYQGTKIQALLESLADNKVLPELEPIWQAACKLRIRIITILDKDYPTSLLELHDPPFCIFFLSEDPSFLVPELNKNLCVVGSRTATSDAVSVAKSLAAKASSYGLCVISGLASGIDVAAHQGSLQNVTHQKVIAVLGNDVSLCFPSSSTKVYKNILTSGGAIISEYPPGNTPMKHQFIARNRIMAALSKCTVIVQAKDKSGALHTAKTALDLGRDVAVLPWSLSVHAGRGSNLLLKDGAYPILSFEDLIDLYPDLKSSTQGIDGLDQNPQSEVLNDEKFRVVIDYLNDNANVPSSVLKELFDLSEVDLINLEIARLIKRSPTSMISLV
jgi:DNA processing protein